jgi:hypothetical protein
MISLMVWTCDDDVLTHLQVLKGAAAFRISLGAWGTHLEVTTL